MNNHYFECTVKYDQVQETGLMKKVNEKYLVEALSFTEAETRMSKEIAQYVSGEYDITAIRRLQVSEIFESKDAAADRWYKSKIQYITLDEKTGREKRTPAIVYVEAKDFDDARNVIQENMQGTLGDWEKAVISDTPIMDLLRFKE